MMFLQKSTSLHSIVLLTAQIQYASDAKSNKERPQYPCHRERRFLIAECLESLHMFSRYFRPWKPKNGPWHCRREQTAWEVEIVWQKLYPGKIREYLNIWSIKTNLRRSLIGSRVMGQILLRYQNGLPKCNSARKSYAPSDLHLICKIENNSPKDKLKEYGGRWLEDINSKSKQNSL